MIAESTDELFMKQAIALARKGEGRTSPNPCVGAVIVKNGHVIGEGYHKKAGTPHAEVHALAAAGEEASGATMYVTLEPCCHTGRTPPCSRAVIAAGIERVVIGMLDPNPLVDGGGRQQLLEHGIDVVAGICEQQCRALNAPFLKFLGSGLPLITLKAGVSLDGRLSYQSGKGGALTGAKSLLRVHEMRDTYDAILVGRSTVESDNPSLTTRLKEGGRDAVRIVLDTELRCSPKATIFHLDSVAPTLVFCALDADPSRLTSFRDQTKAEVIAVERGPDGKVDLYQMCRVLTQKGILSLLVEGGGTIHGAFLRHKLADRVALFYAPLLIGSAGAPLISEVFTAENRETATSLKNMQLTRLGEDFLVEGELSFS